MIRKHYIEKLPNDKLGTVCRWKDCDEPAKWVHTTNYAHDVYIICDVHLQRQKDIYKTLGDEWKVR